jgi:putative transposase
MFLRELPQKHNIESVVFLVDGAQHLQTTLARAGLRFQVKRMEIGTPSNDSFENSNIELFSLIVSATHSLKLLKSGSKHLLPDSMFQTTHDPSS